MYGLALLAYKAGRLDDARGYTRRIAQLPAPAPEALYLGMCVERKASDRAAETLYVVQLRNRYPDSAEAKAVTTGLCE
jgi:Tfp pilus assembly protein PilF